MSWYLFSTVIHIFSAMFWIGGVIVYALVIIAIIRDPEFKDIKLRLLQKTALQFRRLSYPVYLLLFISGVYLTASKGLLYDLLNFQFGSSSMTKMVVLKVSLFLILVLSSIYHDFFTGPRTFRYAETNPRMFEKNRKLSAFFGKLNLLISVFIGVMGILISRGVSIF
ncbi:MAG: hypothetical protein O9264_16010 [Leptospira sp.]|nr:hypothetical protein [Leptospira sp.]